MATMESVGWLEKQYDVNMEAEAKAWIEAVLGEPLPEGTFAEALKSSAAAQQLMPGLALRAGGDVNLIL